MKHFNESKENMTTIWQLL